jgi:hypothetical protein
MFFSTPMTLYRLKSPPLGFSTFAQSMIGKKVFCDNNNSYFSSHTICETTDVRIGQFGVYDLFVPETSETGSGSSYPECEIQTALDPVDPHIAILYCSLILLAIGAIYQIFEFFRRKGFFRPILTIFWYFQRRIGYKVHEVKIMIKPENFNF